MNVFTTTRRKAELQLGDILCDRMQLVAGGSDDGMLSFDLIRSLELVGEDTVVNGDITLHGQTYTVITREDHSILYDALEGVIREV